MKTVFTILALLATPLLAQAGDFASLCADRAAIEQVYHAHRTGTKQPFELAMPPELIGNLTRQDQHKEDVLRRVYGVEITRAMMAAELERIDTTTRAPEVLAEIKAALGNDSARYEESFVKPIIVERELHRRFENDAALHAKRRKEAEAARADLLAGKPLEDLHEATWQLTSRPEEDKRPASMTPAIPTQADSGSVSYQNEATAQLAQTLNHPKSGTDQEKLFYFEDLHPELQNVLRIQLQKPGDVSAVIEMPNGFLVFQAKQKTEAMLQVASLTLPKRSYEIWLEENR